MTILDAISVVLGAGWAYFLFRKMLKTDEILRNMFRNRCKKCKSRIRDRTKFCTDCGHWNGREQFIVLSAVYRNDFRPPYDWTEVIFRNEGKRWHAEVPHQHFLLECQNGRERLKLDERGWRVLRRDYDAKEQGWWLNWEGYKHLHWSFVPDSDNRELSLKVLNANEKTSGYAGGYIQAGQAKAAGTVDEREAGRSEGVVGRWG